MASFIYATGADSRIRKWKVISKTAAAINPILESRFAHEGTIVAMALSPTADFLRLPQKMAAGRFGTLKLCGKLSANAASTTPSQHSRSLTTVDLSLVPLAANP